MRWKLYDKCMHLPDIMIYYIEYMKWSTLLRSGRHNMHHTGEFCFLLFLNSSFHLSVSFCLLLPYPLSHTHTHTLFPPPSLTRFLCNHRNSYMMMKIVLSWRTEHGPPKNSMLCILIVTPLQGLFFVSQVLYLPITVMYSITCHPHAFLSLSFALLLCFILHYNIISYPLDFFYKLKPSRKLPLCVTLLTDNLMFLLQLNLTLCYSCFFVIIVILRCHGEEVTAWVGCSLSTAWYGCYLSISKVLWEHQMECCLNTPQGVSGFDTPK